MENRLRSLRKVMKSTTFNNMNFTDYHRQKVKEEIDKLSEKEEDIILAVLQLLAHEKTGYDLAKNLRSRGIKKFEANEGMLYTLLHKLEQSRSLQSRWVDSETKLYSLNDKGRKILQKAERNSAKKRFVFKELLEG